MVKLKNFSISVAYSQISVCNELFAEDVYEFTQEELKQGFLCVPGYTIFKTLWDAVRCSVEVHLEQTINPSPNAIRAISVPFPINNSGRIRILNSMLSTDEEIQLECGEYTLLFENGIEEEYVGLVEQSGGENVFHPDVPLWCKLTFVPIHSDEPKILRFRREPRKIA